VFSLIWRRPDGDQDAFGRFVAPLRRELHAHCYRMLGSTHDADDALQDALLRAWRGLAGFDGRGSLRSWLYTVATRTCLDGQVAVPSARDVDPQQTVVLARHIGRRVERVRITRLGRDPAADRGVHGGLRRGELVHRHTAQSASSPPV
jgi:RNA polymerase sigma-70 factor (ECF subfamily)